MQIHLIGARASLGLAAAGSLRVSPQLVPVESSLIIHRGRRETTVTRSHGGPVARLARVPHVWVQTRRFAAPDPGRDCGERSGCGLSGASVDDMHVLLVWKPQS